MLIIATIVLSGALQNHDRELKGWPEATADNGYSQYLVAARIAESAYWKALKSGKPSSKAVSVLRDEAKHSDPIYEALRKGNSMPVFNPRKSETIATLYPEYSAFKKVTRIACDVAYIKAEDGDLDSASQWLIQADQFAFRLPEGAFSIKQSLLSLLRQTTVELLPRFSVRQLGEQCRELQTIAAHPTDPEATARLNLQIFNRSIPDVVADPSSLGMPDDAPDIPGAFAKFRDVPKLTTAMQKLTDKIMSSAPSGVQPGDAAYLKYLVSAESQVPVQDRATYEQLIEAFRAALHPAKYKLSEFAKSMDATSKAHAVELIETYCDAGLQSQIDAFQRPEKKWCLPWKSREESDLTAQMVKDGKEGKFAKMDFYALKFIEVFSRLPIWDDSDVTWQCRSQVLAREKARLAVVDARIWLYEKLHGRLPSSLIAIGNPKDPLSGTPYSYRRTGASTFTLAAVGVPGIPKIDEQTKPRPSQS